MSWPPTRVAQLLEGAPSRYERCPADPAFAVDQIELLVDSECQHVLFAAMRQDWNRANVDAYDAARKSIEMLLLAHGWRVRNAPGAQAATGDVAAAWLGAEEPPGPRLAKSFAAARPARHAAEYPSPRDATVADRELRGYTLDTVRLVNRVRTELSLAGRDDLVPMDANVAAWRESL